MHRSLLALLMIGLLLPACLSAQQQATVISRCGGTETVTIPSITDADQDGMDDRLEQLLLNKFMPKIIQFSDESCPGPALDGTGDSNLIVCHIYPVPQQYTRSSSYDSILVHPVALVPSRGLVPGLIWYYPLVKVNCAILYGKDCGALGHTADVEGFNFSLKYIGPDTLAGWMYDTTLTHWMADTIQTVSHAGTLCEHVETLPMKSLYISWGADSVYCSPDKHGNYLTIGGCGSSFICNPGCGNTKSLKHVRNINIGEPNATLVADLGSLYPAYAGNDPWASANFLSVHSGNAGAIRDKMLLSLSSAFIHGHTLTAQQICPLYAVCFGPFAHTYSDQTCIGTPYQFHTRSLTQSGTYRDTLSNANGCDSIVTLTLTVHPVDSISYQAAVCGGDSYSFHGQQLTISGTYHDTLSDVHGCDSMVKLNLTVYSFSTHSYNAVSCDTTYTFAGHTLSASGTYADTLTDIHGCDSIITLSLTIDSLAPPTWGSGGIDTVLAHSHAIILTGTQPAGGVYTGVGVRGNVFYVDSVQPGTHVVTYTYTDTLGCNSTVTKTIEVVLTGINEINIEDVVSLYPNPVTDMLSAESAFFVAHDVSVAVYDVMGKAVPVSYTQHDNDVKVNCSPLAHGVYWIKFMMNGQSVSGRFVKGG
ncbi:MAG: gliding motility-related protein [Bacteroidetes bacterium]|nr:gliding motility-related protein [Bacteroidota bacterium]